MVKKLNRFEAAAGVAVVALLVVGCFVVLRPFVTAILWAAVLTYTTWPLLLHLDRRLRGRRSLAAFIMTVLIALVIVLPFVAVGIKLAENVYQLENLLRVLQDGMPVEAPGWIRSVPWIGPAVEHAWPGLAQNAELISNMLRSAGLKAGQWLLTHTLDVGRGILQLSLSVLIAFAFYRDGDRLTNYIVTAAHRILGDASQCLLNRVCSTLRGVVYGIIGSALAQAIAATIGFWVAGLPSPFLLGLLTFVLAFIPGGPPFVWVPATLWLFHERSVGWGIFMAVWGFFAISGIDNLVRPYLISRGSHLPFVIVLLGALGGVIAFGFIGLFLGPVLLSVGYAVASECTLGGLSAGGEAPSCENAATEPKK